ncbi:hypothetical protein PG593_09435 [Riemerella anatipestifer]|nr:hypothetical protein [Riemerella anatipestifer]
MEYRRTLKSMFWGAVGGAATFGIGSIFNVAGEAGKLTVFASNLKESIGGVGLAIVQAGTHAISQGVLGLMQGQDFLSSAVSGFAGSLGASGFGAIAGDWAGKAGGQIFFGALSGGIGAELTGGNFWQGAITGGIVAGLNHVAHSGDNNTNPPPPEEDDWITKAINFLSGGAVDDAHAMLALDASNASTLDKAMFNIALNSRDIKSEFMGYGMGARGRAVTMLTRAEMKSIKSFQNQINQHKIKLKQYTKNPMKYDNKGFLKNAPNDAVRQRIIQARIKHLKHEIKTFESNINKIKNK